MAEQRAGRPARRTRRYVTAPGGELLFAVAGLLPAVLGGAYALAVLYAGTLLSLTVVGLPFVAAALAGARGLGALHRRAVERLLGERVEPPVPPRRPAGPLARGRAVLADPVAWRSLVYLLARLPLGLLGFAAVVVLPLGSGWLLGFPLWVRLLEPGERPAGWLDAAAVLLGLAVLAAVPGANRVLSTANRRLARLLLGPARSQRRVRDLEQARATLLAAGTDRLRRLERDLHDGTQAQLVALAITLSLADDVLASAPSAGGGPDDSGPDGGGPDNGGQAGPGPDVARLRALVDRARNQTDDTIAGLRRLTAGIHPVALDGGLEAALPGLAAGSPVPVAVRLDLRERPDPAIEQAVYYCAAELLTNLAKHSGARSAVLSATAAGGLVRLTVRDDGRGGAAAAGGASGGGAGGGTGGGTGLAGLGERLAAVDGVLRVESPVGGPTVVTAELPSRI
ncbi:sensor histidine kinase [Kitasatospora sp. NBC_01560]|uniref:sensor histidine kinase n=1 Tax=Kitasatospora sp. NBC_01560 TaxID=2975965 RepID=UPI003867DE23